MADCCSQQERLLMSPRHCCSCEGEFVAAKHALLAILTAKPDRGRAGTDDVAIHRERQYRAGEATVKHVNIFRDPNSTIIHLHRLCAPWG